MSILIKNGKVWDGEKFFFADVFIEGDVVSAIGENLDRKAEFIYDAEGKIVSTGLVDIHVHMQGISPNLYGINAEMACVPFGVTCAVDGAAVFGDVETSKQRLVKHLVFVGAHFSGNKAYFTKAEEMLEKYQGKIAGVKAFFDDTNGQVSDIQPLKEVVAFAEEKGLRVMVHTTGSPTTMQEIVDVLRPGDIITHSYHGGKNNAALDNYQCIKQAKKRGICIDVGYAGSVHADFKVLKDAIVCGAKPDTISTDITKCSAYKRGGKYGMTACMSIAKALGMEEEEVLTCVTSAAAKAVQMQESWGYLRVGRKADICVLQWTEEPFHITDEQGNSVSLEEGYKNCLTIIDGVVVYRN